MEKNKTSFFSQNKRLIGIVFTVSVLLLLPIIAMQFTNEVNWNISDFIVAGILLLGTGFLIELIIRKVKRKNYQIILSLVALLTLLIIWIQLAVGIFD